MARGLFKNRTNSLRPRSERNAKTVLHGLRFLV